MKQRYSYLLFLFSAFCLLMAQSSYAQNYPDRTIKSLFHLRQVDRQISWLGS